MRATAVALDSPRQLSELLRAAGWDHGAAGTAAAGVMPAAVRVSGVDPGALPVLVRHAGSLGLEILTGPDWAVVAGARSRLGALARPWAVPEMLRAIAEAIGPALAGEPAAAWRTARGSVSLDRPLVLGILNVTPDSFSDGGRFLDPAAAVARAQALAAAGADLVDVGGESTRPGRSGTVSEADELHRVLPVLRALARTCPDLRLSVDTMKAGVARAALEEGAVAINDVTALRHDPAVADAVAAAGAGLILMHSRGEALDLASYRHADYGGDVIGSVADELALAVRRATERGVAAEAIALDPGFGFGKTPEQSQALADGIGALLALGRPICVGPSRKRFLGVATGREPEDRDVATAAACALLRERGARLFRVHDVAAARDALAVTDAFVAR